jgi:uncharacterized tellurite resistance protein B-like protein
MTAVRSLQTLFEAADALTGKADSASLAKTAAVVSETDLLAAQLLGADQPVEIEPALEAPESEKVAMAMNRVHTASFLDAVVKVENFEKQAREEGFSEAQIEEALSKTAAKALIKNLPEFVAATSAAGKPSDLNIPKKNPSGKPTLSQQLGRLPLTKNLGY